MPIGAYAEVTAQEMSLTAIVTTLDGTRTARAQGRGATNDPERLGLDVAERLLANGADAILTEVRRAQASVEGLQP